MTDFPIHCFERTGADTICPEALWQVDAPPERIYVQGSERALSLLSQLPEHGLAIVGTREPQARSLALIQGEIRRLSRSRLVILSGFARGIDAQAHLCALETGLLTLAVVASGLDVPYPRENQNLKKRILEAGGLCVSEHPPGTQPHAGHFLQRNRLIAGWSKAVWVVEAPHRSGALNTAKWARDQHRDLYATPCYPGDLALSGNQVLLDRDHARSFWNAYSLGSTWLGIGEEAPRARKTTEAAGQLQLTFNTDEVHLVQHVKQLTAERGGSQVQELLDWAIARGWEPSRFFFALQNSILSKEIFDCEGILVSGQSHNSSTL